MFELYLESLNVEKTVLYTSKLSAVFPESLNAITTLVAIWSLANSAPTALGKSFGETPLALAFSIAALKRPEEYPSSIEDLPNCVCDSIF